MLKSIFSVYDQKAEKYGPLQLVDSPAVFTRDFHDYIRREPTSVVAEHPEDFTVYCLGSFDDQSGVITSFVLPEKMFDVSVLVSKPE